MKPEYEGRSKAGFSLPKLGSSVGAENCSTGSSTEYGQVNQYSDNARELSLMTPRTAHFAQVWRETMSRFWQSWESVLPWFGECQQGVEHDDLQAEHNLQPIHFNECALDQRSEGGIQHGVSSERFEPCLEGDGALSRWRRPIWLSTQQSGRGDNSDPSWLTWARSVDSGHDVAEQYPCAKDSELSLPDQCGKGGSKERRVSFHEEIDITCFFEDDSLSYRINQSMSQKCFRSLWHEFGQIAEYTRWKSVLATYQVGASGDEIVCGQQSEIGPSVGGSSRTEESPWSFDEVLPDILQEVQPADASRRPVFADTWFLAKERFPLCLRPRKLRLEDGFWGDLATLHQKARELWADLDDGSSLHLQAVMQAPQRMPAISFHLILVQGGVEECKWTLFHSILSPTFYKLRAVLHPQQCTVKEFFRLAQVDVDCGWPQRSCFLSFSHNDFTTFLHNEEIFRGSFTGFAEGGIRSIHDDSEDDMAEVDTAEESDGGTTCCPDESSEDDDIASFMSSSAAPFQCQFDDEGAYPWMQMGLEDPEDQPMHDDEQEGPPPTVNFAEGHWDHLLEEMEHMHEAARSEDEPWIAATFGFNLFDLGRRDVEFQAGNMESLKAAIEAAWGDHLRFGDITVYTVHPQPINVIGQRTIALLVVMANPEDLDEATRYVLVIEEAVDDVGARPEPYGASLINELNDRQVLFHLDLHHHCPPFALRPFYVRMGMVMMVQGQRYNYDHGTLCKTWIGNIPSQVSEAEQQVGDVETFFLQVMALCELRSSREVITCHVHGITPGNRPMGHREMQIPAEWIYDLEWIRQMGALWPFMDENVILQFVAMATADMREEPNVVFHFLASGGTNEGVPILVNQQLISVDAIQRDPTGVDEFWAIHVPNGEIGVNIVGALQGPPFWFSFARTQQIRPHMMVNGKRILQTDGHWRHGDVLRARFLVWQQIHTLEILMGMMQEETDNQPEHTSLLQRKANIKDERRNGQHQHWEPFAELCFSLIDQQDDEIRVTIAMEQGSNASSAEEHSHKQLEYSECGSGGNLDPTWHAEQGSSQIASLNAAVAYLCLPGWKGVNVDIAEVPQIHPFARIACQHTAQDQAATGTFHVFTDGSCQKGHAAWAFVILCAQTSAIGTTFTRVGFAGGKLADDLGPVSVTPHDAESTAIIAACEYLLSRRDVSTIRVYLHFDAMAAGFGSTGQSNLIEQNPTLSQRQRAARIMVSLVQRRNNAFLGCHVHAHDGQPWNEMADSIAKQVAQGWQPNNVAELRSGKLLQHPLREWAWLQISPTEELPCLERVLQNEVPNPSKATIDATLETNQERMQNTRWAATLNFASINVGTLEQHLMPPQMQVTHQSCRIDATVFRGEPSFYRSAGKPSPK